MNQQPLNQKPLLVVVELAVLIDVEFFGLEDGSINGGSGYYAPAGGTQVYNNVDLHEW